MCRVYFVLWWVPWFWPSFVGSGLLGTGESISDEWGVVGIAEHHRSPVQGPSWMCRVYFVYWRVSWSWPVFGGKGLLGTGESRSDECDVDGIAEHHRSPVQGSQLNVPRLLCVLAGFMILTRFRREGLLGTGESISDECGVIQIRVVSSVECTTVCGSCHAYNKYPKNEF